MNHTDDRVHDEPKSSRQATIQLTRLPYEPTESESPKIHTLGNCPRNWPHTAFPRYKGEEPLCVKVKGLSSMIQLVMWARVARFMKAGRGSSLSHSYILKVV